MLRQVPFLVALAAFVTSPAQAQGHTMHHHPRGAKIIMIGTVVDPMCAFVQQAADSAQARCADQQRDTPLPPMLIADGELYVLKFGETTAASVSAARPLLGTRVKVDGTVYPAGNSYLIVVDSIRARGL